MVSHSVKVSGVRCVAAAIMGPGVLLAALLSLAAPDARAGSLNFNFDPNGPSLFAGSGTLSYNAATGEFQSTTTPLFYSSSKLSGSPFFFSNSQQLGIDLFVNSNGSFNKNGTGIDLSGTLTIGGTAISGTLLTGTVTAFGADPAGPPSLTFDVLFTVTGGLLTMPNGSVPTQFTSGEAVGIELMAEDVTSGTLGNFGANFASDSVRGSAGALVVPVPEPSALALTAASAFGMLILVSGFRRPALKAGKQKR